MLDCGKAAVAGGVIRLLRDYGVMHWQVNARRSQEKETRRSTPLGYF
jgi:hypothetical protein